MSVGTAVGQAGAGNHAGLTAGAIAVGVLLLVVAFGGVMLYRRTLGRGPYSGPLPGAMGVASMLGVFLGLSVGLGTLFVVLLVKALT